MKEKVQFLPLSNVERINKLEEEVKKLREELQELKKTFEDHTTDNHADKKPYWWEE